MARLIMALVMVGLVTPALAAQGASHTANGAVMQKLDDPRDIARRLPVISTAQASQIALGRLPETVLGMEMETNDGIRTWQVDIASDAGRIVRLWLNANTGAFLRMVER